MPGTRRPTLTRTVGQIKIESFKLIPCYRLFYACVQPGRPDRPRTPGREKKRVKEMCGAKPVRFGITHRGRRSAPLSPAVWLGLHLPTHRAPTRAALTYDYNNYV
ncbi:hypothetical protein EVA_19284 [gut metagenome]|uniref:Uncharacterized protein n=1 Tax=gut metagenome TaxID=749906 RepID=J9FDX2_9ZZZZ